MISQSVFLFACTFACYSYAEKIKVTTIEEEPYLTRDGSNFKGFIPELMDKIAKKENIAYELSVVADNKYGMKGSDGNWNGLIGEVMNRKAEMAAAPITLSEARENVVDFTTAFMNFGTTVITSKPADGQVKFKNVRDLADQTEIKYGMIKDGETERFFKNSQDNAYKKMWNYMNQHRDLLVDKVEDGVKKVRDSKGKYAFIIESSSADFWIMKEPCDLVKVGSNINSRQYGFIVRKGNTSLKEKLDRAINALKKDKTIEKLKNKWWEADSKCSAGEAIRAKSVMQVLSLIATAFFIALLR